jgi:site-specific DNA-adenine methylase
MSRSATAGTDYEFRANLSVRWNNSGGDSAVRFRHATESLEAWGRVMRRCTFVCLDVFDFLDRVDDQPQHGLYLDPPFPGPGDRYKHSFGEGEHRGLATRLGKFRNCRVVCRFYDHPLVRELYPEGRWEWVRLTGRTQANASAPEVLLRCKI